MGDAIRILQEKVNAQDKEELVRNVKGRKISELEKSTSAQEIDKGRIHTVIVTVLLPCKCRCAKECLDIVIRNEEINVYFQRPEEMLEFVVVYFYIFLLYSFLKLFCCALNVRSYRIFMIKAHFLFM
jgi:hypothetical protein